MLPTSRSSHHRGWLFGAIDNVPPGGPSPLKPLERVDEGLRSLCLFLKEADGSRTKLKSDRFQHISYYLRSLDGCHYPNKIRRDYCWCLRPRLYAVLNNLNATDLMREFVLRGYTDMQIPFTYDTLPDFIKDEDLKLRFLEYQGCVSTDARKLWHFGDHVHFDESADEHIAPYKHLGQGGYGSVDSVLSKLNLDVYARKRVHRTTKDPAAEKCLIAEIETMKRLKHPHLTEIIGSYSDPRHIAYLMKPVADDNLLGFLSRTDWTAESDAKVLRQIFGCLAGAVEYLHRNSIRHRDLKPHNVLVKGSHVYIADFGSALDWSTMKRGTTQDRNAPMTPDYMAPEVAERGAERNAASDMWSLGIIFLNIVTVLKGHTVKGWREFISKRARAAKNESWPCRNMPAINEWMEVLQGTSPSPEVDNEPLTWIKNLLHANPNHRSKSRSLVKAISESPYFKDFCCFDCAVEFESPSFFYATDDPHNSRNAPERTREEVDGEVSALIGAGKAQEALSSERTRTIQNWLQQTQEDIVPFEIQSSTTIALHMDQEASYSEAAPSISNTSSELASDQQLHECGFFVQDDGGRSDSTGSNEESYDGELFAIINDSSSNASESLAIDFEADPVTAEKESELTTILEEPDSDPEPTPCGSPAEDNKEKVADQNASSVIGHCHDHTPTSKISSNQNPSVEDVPNEHSKHLFTNGFPSTTLENTKRSEPVTDLKPSAHESGYEQKTRDAADQKLSPPVKDDKEETAVESKPANTVNGEAKPSGPDENLDKTSYAKTAPKSDRSVTCADTLKPEVEQDDTFPPSYESIAPNATEETVPPDDHATPIKSKRSRLSTANVVRFNSEVHSIEPKASKKNEDFDAIEYMDSIWRRMEEATSVATSAMSETTNEKIATFGSRAMDKDGSLLEICCRDGKVKGLRRLLDKQCNPGTRSQPRPKPLLLAIKGASQKHNKCVRALITNHCDVNAVFRKRTPIHWAIDRPYFDGYGKLICLLLAAGAEMNRADGYGEFPLLKLFAGPTSAPLQRYQTEALALALHPKVPTKVDVHVRQRASLNTALHLAVQRRTPAAVAVLVHRGADVNAENASGTTPLLMAANQWRASLTVEQERILRYLLDAPDLQIDTRGGSLDRTALQHAVAAVCVPAVEMLLDNGASAYLMDKEGNNAVDILEKARKSANEAEYSRMKSLLSQS